MNSPEISIIIVNFNVKFFLENCLISILKSVKNISAEIIVVDNNSSDGTKPYFENRFTDVRFIFLSENVGFAKANNEGLKMATGKFILFLNPDTIIAEDSIELCVNYMRLHDNCGALGVRMIDGSGSFLKESKRGLPNTKNAFGKLSGLEKIFPSLFGGYYANHLKENQTCEVDILAGAFFFTRKEILNTIGSFDEIFFMFGEDIDLSYRIQKAGYQNVYLAETTILHFKGESIQKKNAAYHKNFFGAMHLFVEKHQKKNKKLLHTAINAKYFLSKLNRIFSHSRSSVSNAKNTAIICSQENFTHVIKILKHANVPVTIIGRIASHKKDNSHCFGYIDQLPVFLKNKTLEQLVICGSDISNKEAFILLSTYANCVSFLFYQEGSNSIVGSDDKNKNGIFISVN